MAPDALQHFGVAGLVAAVVRGEGADKRVYVAGTTGVDVTTGDFAGATVKEQARQSLLNCQAILRAATGSGATRSAAIGEDPLLGLTPPGLPLMPWLVTVLDATVT